MNEYCFRLRFDISEGSRIATDVSESEIKIKGGPQEILLIAVDRESTIASSKSFVLKGAGYRSLESAHRAGLEYEDVLRIMLAKLRIGNDIGARHGGGGFVDSVLTKFGKKAGLPAMNERLGLHIYQCDPSPVFVSLEINVSLGCTLERLLAVFDCVDNEPPKLDEKTKVALELFNVSFFLKSSDAKFITLMMAAESLFNHRCRDKIAQDHVQSLIKMTESNAYLDDKDRKSFLGSLTHLKKESISQSGARTAKEKLGDREYIGLPSDRFFREAYKIRSSMMHGNLAYPNAGEVGKWAANMEVFVSDLITSGFVDNV